MQSDILERIRVLESDIERRRDAVVEQQLLPIENSRHALMRDRFVAQQLQQLSTTASQLLDLYLDGDELPAVQEGVVPLDAMVSFFNARVAGIREYYRTYPKADGEVEEELIEPDVDALLEDGVFHPNEKFGTRLHLDPHHAAFVNFFVRCARGPREAEVRKEANSLRDTFAHVDKFIFNPTQALVRTPQRLKLLEGERYLAFVTDLKDYLIGFFERTRPLEVQRLRAQLTLAGAAFEDYWRQVEEVFAANGGEAAAAAASSSTAGQQQSRFQAAAVPRAHPFLLASWDLRTVSSKELRDVAKKIGAAEAAIGVIALPPTGLMAGIIRSSAEGQQADHSKLLIERRREEDAAEEAFLDSLENMEERLKIIRSRAIPKVGGEGFDLDLLTLNGTASSSSGAAGGAAAGGHKSTVISGDIAPAAIGDKVDLADDKGLVDNDGNPLPTWQIKLEGRRKRFTCEVCAGTVYHGPKQWNEHFRFSRHTEGLRRLGIVNTHEYDGVYTILGVQQLAALLRDNKDPSLTKRIREEREWMEVEDEYGLVQRRGRLENRRI